MTGSRSAAATGYEKGLTRETDTDFSRLDSELSSSRREHLRVDLPDARLISSSAWRGIKPGQEFDASSVVPRGRTAAPSTGLQACP